MFTNYKTDLRNLYAGLNRQHYLMTGEMPKQIKVTDPTKLYNGRCYKQLQRRNSVIFNSLSQEKQNDLREMGYNNKGWENVKESWRIMWKYFN